MGFEIRYSSLPYRLLPFLPKQIDIQPDERFFFDQGHPVILGVQEEGFQEKKLASKDQPEPIMARNAMIQRLSDGHGFLCVMVGDTTCPKMPPVVP